MEITLQYFDGCPNWMVTAERLQLLAAEHSDAVLVYQRVDTVDMAEQVRFRGSPTVLVDGVDVMGDTSAAVGLACRVYMTGDGPAGAPSMAQLREAILG